MIFYFVRYRAAGEQEWQSWKFTHVSGRLHAYLAISASRSVLKQVAAALDYAITGVPSPLLQEVALQLGDNGGHTWLVQRRGKEVRVAKDGAPLDAAQAEQELTEACRDGFVSAHAWEAGHERLNVGHFEIRSHENGGECQLRLARLGAPVSAEADLKATAEAQISSVAQACAQRFNRPQLAQAKTLSALARKLDPLRAQYTELCRQYNELKNDAKDLLAKDASQTSTLIQELELLDHLATAAEPLLQPGVSLKTVRDELSRLTGERTELRQQLGLGEQAQAVSVDFQTAIDALSRVEAQARLIQALGKARKQLAEQIEPLFQRYVQVAEGGLGDDQQTQAELASCLAGLTARLKQKAHLQRTEGLTNDKQKTWFDRFKNRAGEGSEAFEETPLERDVADLETAHMAITYTLGRLSELQENLKHVGKKHDTALGAIDAAYEELVRGFSALKSGWQELARTSGLPEDMTLNKLLQLASGYGSLAQVEAQHRAASDKAQRFQTALHRVERLLLDWRKATGSQKTVDLNSPAILLSEASSLLRYRDSKRQRLSQVKEQAVAAKAAAGILALLKKRRQNLAETWQAAFAGAGVQVLEIHDEAVGELCRSGQLVEALAMVHTAVAKTKPMALFTPANESFTVTVYHWDDEQTPAKERLAFLADLDRASGDALHVLLLADESLGMAVAPAGMGKGTLVASQMPRAPQTQAPVIPGAPRPTPNVIKAPAQRPQQTQQAQPSASQLLNEKARQTLAMLTTTRKS